MAADIAAANPPFSMLNGQYAERNGPLPGSEDQEESVTLEVQRSSGSDQAEIRDVKSAVRTLDLLEELARSPAPRSLGDLARVLRIPKSSLHGLLRTLERRGWVECDDTGLRFRLGVHAVNLASSYSVHDREMRIMRAAMDRIWQETGETVQLARLVDGDIVYLAQVPARHPVRLVSAVGERLPAHATALGKALLSARSESDLEELLHPPLVRLTEKTLVEMEPLQAALRVAREAGLAWDEEEASQGLICAATVVPADGLPTHAISVSVPSFRLSPELKERLPVLLLETAKSLRVELGIPDRSGLAVTGSGDRS